MLPHSFIFSTGIWIGEGKITFSTSPEHIKFYTKWQVSDEENGLFVAKQTVEMQGIKEHVVNIYTFQTITPNNFTLSLANDLMGKVKGKGVIDQNTIAWELLREDSFEGFEVYERQENGDYTFHAEYSSTEQYRTIVEGLIWQKSS